MKSYFQYYLYTLKLFLLLIFLSEHNYSTFAQNKDNYFLNNQSLFLNNYKATIRKEINLSAQSVQNIFYNLKYDIMKIVNNKNNHDINHKLLELILDDVSLKLSDLNQFPEEKTFSVHEQKQLINSFVFFSELFSMVIYSQSWLSPTNYKSPVKERGVLQSDHYGFSYEREKIKPSLAEKLLKEQFFNNPEFHSLLFRNKNCALSEILLFLYNELSDQQLIYFISPNLKRSSSLTVKQIVNLNPTQYTIISKKSKNEKILPELQNIEGLSSVILDDRDIKDNLDLFLVEISKNPSLRNIIIDAGGVLKIKDFTLNLLQEKNIKLIILTDLQKSFDFGKYLLFDSNTQIALSIFNKTCFNLLSSLLTQREMGGNIDSYHRWLTTILTDSIQDQEIDKKTIDSYEFTDPRNAQPNYYDDLNINYFKSRQHDLLDKYDELHKLFDTLTNQKQKSSKILSNFSIDLLQKFTKLIINTIDKNNQKLKLLINSATEEENDLDSYRMIFKEYRTLLKLTAKLFELEIRLDLREDNSLSLLTENETFLNNLHSIKSDYNLTQDSLLFSSGVAAMKTLFHLLSSKAKENQQEILVGANSYFEGISYLNQTESITKQYIIETQTDEIIKKLQTNRFNALFIDPVANQIENGIYQDSLNIPVTDLQKIMQFLFSKTFSTPFYLVLDTSISAHGFQLMDILKTITAKKCPDNLFIILNSSTQKFHQDGKEITMGGFASIISNNDSLNNELIYNLKKAQNNLGSAPDSYSIIAHNIIFKTFVHQMQRTDKIHKNAEIFAKYCQNIFNLFSADSISSSKRPHAYHPALPSHPEHTIWLKNHKPGVPFVFLDFGHDSATSLFTRRLLKRFAENKMVHLQRRDSFGFNRLSAVLMFHPSRFAKIRLSFAPLSDAEMKETQKIFLKEVISFFKNTGVKIAKEKLFALAA